jgi:hypothetical protein
MRKALLRQDARKGDAPKSAAGRPVVNAVIAASRIPTRADARGALAKLSRALTPSSH